MCYLETHLKSDHATTRIARFLSQLASLRIVAIASYYASSCLATHDKKRTLRAVQLRNLG